MNCSHPVKIYKSVSKELHEGGLLVPCGKCPSCLSQRSLEWSVRLLHELSYWKKAIFITLTYNDENIPLGYTLKKKDLQLFFKLLRNKKYKIKYYACGEYGEKYRRPHYHAIVFGMDFIGGDLLEINNLWGKGFVSGGLVTPERCRYVAQYVMKKVITKRDRVFYDDVGLEVPFQLQSQGLGKSFALDNFSQIIGTGLTLNGKNIGVPRYYQKKLNLLNNKEYLAKVVKQGAQKNIRLAKQLLREGKNIGNAIAVTSRIKAGLKQSEANVKARQKMSETRRRSTF